MLARPDTKPDVLSIINAAQALMPIRRRGANEPRRTSPDRGVATHPSEATPQPSRQNCGADDDYDPAYDDGITYAICQLAELTGSNDWQMKDGSEDHATDVRDTIMDVLKCAGLYDDEDGQFAKLNCGAGEGVRADQIEVAARAMYEFEPWEDGTTWETMPPASAESFRETMRFVFAALAALPGTGGEK